MRIIKDVFDVFSLDNILLIFGRLVLYIYIDLINFGFKFGKYKCIGRRIFFVYFMFGMMVVIDILCYD